MRARVKYVCIFALSAGCSSFVGTRDRGDADVADVDAPADVSTLCAIPRLACDPVNQRGCNGSFGCVVRSIPVFSAECASPGTRTAGSGCTRAEDCAVGMSCLGGRCARPCCPSLTPDPCGVSTPGTRCAGATGDDALTVCTLPSDCDYRSPDACGAGRVCRVRNALGAADCVPAGRAGLDETCEAPDECTTGLTCVLLSSSAPGRCRPACNPLDDRCAPSTYCSIFADRPRDFGACLR